MKKIGIYVETGFCFCYCIVKCSVHEDNYSIKEEQKYKNFCSDKKCFKVLF